MVALVTLSDTKDRLRIETSDDDAVIEGYIEAASAAVMNYLKGRAEELIDQPAGKLVEIGERELAAKEAAFAAAAARIDSTRPTLAVWADVLKDHPARGEVVAAAQKAVDELQAFVVARRLVNLPQAEKVAVAAARPFDLGLASMHASPPLETTPVTSYYYITDALAGRA